MQIPDARRCEHSARRCEPKCQAKCHQVRADQTLWKMNQSCSQVRVHPSQVRAPSAGTSSIKCEQAKLSGILTRPCSQVRVHSSQVRASSAGTKTTKCEQAKLSGICTKACSQVRVPHSQVRALLKLTAWLAHNNRVKCLTP